LFYFIRNEIRFNRLSSVSLVIRTITKKTLIFLTLQVIPRFNWTGNFINVFSFFLFSPATSTYDTNECFTISEPERHRYQRSFCWFNLSAVQYASNRHIIITRSKRAETDLVKRLALLTFGPKRSWRWVLRDRKSRSVLPCLRSR